MSENLSPDRIESTSNSRNASTLNTKNKTKPDLTDTGDDLEASVTTNESASLLPDSSRGELPSEAPNLSSRITEDIINGLYECPICNENLRFRTSLWSCSDCFQVYNFDCIKQWAERHHEANWPCPTCKTMNRPLSSKATCWCRLSEFDEFRVTRNSCGRLCFSLGSSIQSADFCSKRCHPGPCDRLERSDSGGFSDTVQDEMAPLQRIIQPPRIYTTSDSQQRVAITAPPPPPAYTASNSPRPARITAPLPSPRIGISRPAQRPRATATPRRTWNYRDFWNEHRITRWKNKLRRWEHKLRRRPTPLNGITLNGAVQWTALFGMIEFLFVIWCLMEVRWQTQPLKYWFFVANHSNGDFWFMVIMSLLVAPVIGYFFSASVEELAYHLVRRYTPNYMPVWKRYVRWTVMAFTRLVILVTFLPLLCWFPIAWHIGPQRAFKHQMKNTCIGFDTRVNLGNVMNGMSDDTFKYTGTSWSGIDLTNTIPNPNEFVMIQHRLEDEISYPKPPIHRMTVPMTEKNYLAIDIDIQNRSWQIIETAANLTSESRKKATAYPREHYKLNHTGERQVRNGTWSYTDKDLTIYDLNIDADTDNDTHLVMPNMNLFLASGRFQPFMKMFRSDNMTELQIGQQSRRPWTIESEDNVVLRTSSFGMGMHDLEICAKRNAFVDRDGIVRSGLGDDALIPIAILGAFRYVYRFVAS